jgi:nucleotide-binding universal stress UspA family protein
MAEKSKSKKIILAVDAFEEKSKTQERVAEVLRTLNADGHFAVEPVYVLSPYELEVPMEFSQPWIRQYRPAAETALRGRLAQLQIPGLLPGRVLIQGRHSLMNSVQSLAAYAKAEGAEMVAVSTHGRKGLPRLFIGSFVETLMLYSKVPVLAVSPLVRAPRNFRKILFPSDLGPKSQSAWKSAVRLAKDLGAEITLLHTVVNPIEPVIQSGVYLLGGGWVPVPVYMTQEEARRRKTGEAWVKMASKAGVSARLEIDTGSHSVLESITAHSEKNKTSLIAMAAQTGKVAAALTGSITREVVRNAPCPVWVLRP